MLTSISAALVSSLLPVWFTLRLVDRYRDKSGVFFLGFAAQFVSAVAAAWLVGVGFDVAGLRMYAPPPEPGNFTLPIPWTFLVPIIQAATFGPVTGLLVGIWPRIAMSTAKRRNL